MKKTLALCTILVMTTICLAEVAKPQAVSPNAVIEAIEFEQVAPARQQRVLMSLGLRVGDRLDADAKQQVGQALRAAQKSVAEQPLTFTYTPGSKYGTAKLIIRSGC